jgi:hypothetical protein
MTSVPSGRMSGHSMLELVIVLALLGTCFAAGGVFLARGIGAVQARGAAQAWQAAATWAQIGAVWEGAANRASFDAGHVAVAADAGTSAGDLGYAASSVQTVANVVGWRFGNGVVVRFTGGSGSPNSAGSLYFRAPRGGYRVIVRLESGLTVRTRVDNVP